MDYTMNSYRDRQVQDLANHRKGCGILFIVFMAVAFIVFLCSLIDNHPEVGLCLAAIVLLIGAVIIGLSFKEYLRKLKETKK
jgi:Ca2+/Na+ antiporter